MAWAIVGRCGAEVVLGVDHAGGQQDRADDRDHEAAEQAGEE